MTAVTTSGPQVTIPWCTMKAGLRSPTGGGEVDAELARQHEVTRLREAGDLRRDEQGRLVRDRP